MKFLLPVGGVVDHRFGILTSPAHNGVPAGIQAGMLWAADNEAYTRGFDPDRFFPWLDRMAQYRDTCLFVVVPDIVGDAQETRQNYDRMVGDFDGWPVAYAAQDGSGDLDMPECDALFIGGSTEWKLGSGAVEMIQRGIKKNYIFTLDA